MTENTNIRSGMYESLNHRWTGWIIVPFLYQISRTEIVIFFFCLKINSLRGLHLEIWSSNARRQCTGCIIAPFLFQISRTEIAIFWVLLSVLEEACQLEIRPSNGQPHSAISSSVLNSRPFWRLDRRKFRTRLSHTIVHPGVCNVVSRAQLLLSIRSLM